MTTPITPDRYPTRTTSTAALLPRTDPALWPGPDGSTLPGPFTADELARYAETGFHAIPRLLSAADLAECQAEADRLRTDPAILADERTVVEQASAEVRSVFEAHTLSPLVARLIRTPAILGRARQILGSEVYVHQSRINYLPGIRGTGFYWHSDFETWHAEDGMPAPRAVSLSIALTDNFPFNGGLMIMPGSHRTLVSCVGATPDGNYKLSLREQRIGTPDEASLTELAYRHGIEQFTGPAGSALWFDCNCMHGSGNNITPFPRSNIFVVFNSVHNALGEPFAAPAPRPGFIASRQVEPLH
jgi:ectoine hydroxylase